MFERQATLVYMLGWIEGTRRGIKRDVALILIDQTLNRMNQPSMTDEEKAIFKDLSDEHHLALNQIGMNHKKIKKTARTGHL